MAKRILLPAYLLLIVSGSFTVHGQWTGPLVYYPFDESAGSLVSDFSGNSFDGVANCDNCWETEGKFNGAFHFQGIHKMELPAKEIGLTNENGTVAFWMLLPESSVNQINCIWWAGEYGGDMFGPQNEMHINSEFVEANIWSGGEIAFVVRDSAADDSYFIFSDPEKGPNPATPPSGNEVTLADDEWHHIACTWESGGTVALYIDGQAIWDTTAYHPNVWECNLMTIGAANERSNRRLSGFLDEFRIYREAFGPAEITAIYNYVPEGPVQSLESNKERGLTVLNCFPNPAGGSISFLPSPGTERIEICSLEGKIIIAHQIPPSPEVIEIDIDVLSSGFYYIGAYRNDRLIATSKIIKE
jgi:hypothetical protein